MGTLVKYGPQDAVPQPRNYRKPGELISNTLFDGDDLVDPTLPGVSSRNSGMRSAGSGGGGGGDDSDDSDDGRGPRHNGQDKYAQKKGPKSPRGASGGGNPPGRDFVFPGGDAAPGDHFGGYDPWEYFAYPHFPGYPGGDGDDGGPPSGYPGPHRHPRNRVPLYIPYPYTRPKSPPLLKLPGITREQYFWDGDTSTLKSKIRLWTREFSKHSPNQVVPWIRSLLPEYYQWRLDQAKNFQECVDALLVLVNDEDVYIKKIEAEIRSYPNCTTIREDKRYLNFLSMKVTKLMDIDQNYVVSPSQCTEFFSKISSQSEQKELNKTIKARQRKANDRLGTMNYERPLQNIIVQQLKLIDTTLSGQVTGTNIDLADENKTQMISHSYNNATSLPIRSAMTT